MDLNQALVLIKDRKGLPAIERISGKRKGGFGLKYDAISYLENNLTSSVGERLCDELVFAVRFYQTWELERLRTGLLSAGL
ncbi:MAG: hypothetical protein ACFB10_18010 [Salibacteraceae bacterium]